MHSVKGDRPAGKSLEVGGGNGSAQGRQIKEPLTLVEKIDLGAPAPPMTIVRRAGSIPTRPN